MKRSVQIIAITGVLLGLMIVTQSPAQDKLPKAETLMDNYIKATGGKAAIEKIKSRVVRGSVSFQGIKGTLVIQQKAPNMMHLTMDLPGIGKIVNGTNGKIVWEINPITGAKIHEGSKKEEMLREAAFDSDVNWRKYYKSAKTVKEENINDKTAYRVDLETKSGHKESRFFDKASGLVVKVKSKVKTDMGEVLVESFFSGYKVFDGLKIATKNKLLLQGLTIEIDSTSIEHNGKIEAKTFAVPAKVKDLLKDL